MSLLFVTDRPTYWPIYLNKIADWLYFFITRKVSLNVIQVQFCSLILTLSERVIRKKTVLKLVYKTTNWKNFKIYLPKVNRKTTDELDNSIMNVQAAAQKLTAQKK